MPLNKAALEASLATILADLSNKTPAQKTAEIATAIDTFVKTGAVVGVTAGGASINIT